MAVTATAPVVHVARPARAVAVAGARETPRRAPMVVGARADVRAEVRTIAGQVVAVLRQPIVESCNWVLNGVGEAVVTWRTDPAVEPAAPSLAPGGRPPTWRDHDVELWVWRQGELVWCGPIVAVTHDPHAGTVTARCWTREGYLQRLILGDAQRTNLLPAGYFDASLTGWEETGSITATAVTSPLYRRDRSMRLVGAGNVAASTRLPVTKHQNVVTVLVVARWAGPGWRSDDTGTRRPAMVIHRSYDAAGGDEQVHGIYPLAMDDQATAGRWLRCEVKVQERAGRANGYEIAVFGPPEGTVWVGEVEIVRAENVSARAGWDWGVYAAAVASECVRMLGAPWGRNNARVGVVLADNVRSDKHDHPDMRSLLADWEVWGDWWIPVAPRPVITTRPRRGRLRPDLVLTPNTTSGLRVTWDATEAATEVILLADGQDGPTREEAAARVSTPLPGARLMRCDVARRGLPARDLEAAAARVLAAEGPARVTVAGDPALGPTRTSGPVPVRDLPGAWVHLIEPGDTVRLGVADHANDYEEQARVVAMTWDPVADTLAVSWEAAP